MHFWIDKRSQCAYTGRHRVPSSLSSGVGRARGRVCEGVGPGPGVAGRKGMAAPLHRFAPLECPPRRHHRHRHNGQPPTPAVHTSRRQNDESSLYVEIPLEPPQPTIASLAAARSVTPDTLLRTAALGLHHSPMMAPHLKFGMLVSFALATLFLAGAKYYFDRQVVRDNASGTEATVVCAAVACVCGVGCALSMCRAKSPPLQTPDRVSSTAQRDRPPPPSEPSDDISLTTLLQSNRQAEATISPEAPPPYHIAVLLPSSRDQPRETSPPAYSALS
ncbi:uncharacterized protein LOC113236055 [Hyposmocoma kahamanoa]|uniref:uncharacterized protein LOC113236055 n=1 Tax=Hyposmocoma kahamanoa TaxID=1477025 RepID=UPI000E6D6A44|nr:uncharacterized protein LOC113236055 [Hyposmocoma kahamanoa]XP_026327833.1 uncharacterized protein LOC113236055 [Hyposmocoma kahamanoa]